MEITLNNILGKGALSWAKDLAQIGASVSSSVTHSEACPLPKAVVRMK